MTHKRDSLDDTSFEASLHCRYKWYLKINDTIGETSDFERHVAARTAAQRKLLHTHLLTRHREKDLLRGPPVTSRALQRGKLFVLDARIGASGLSATIDAIQKVDGTSALGDYLYHPIQLSYHERPTKVEKLMLAFRSLVVAELQGQIPSHGFLIFGSQLQRQKVTLHAFQRRVRRLIEALRLSAAASATPPLLLTQHCPNCEYHSLCRAEAVKTDNLSLLGGMSEREIAKQNRKGIFTVNQLSYTFRYRRTSKRAKRPSNPHHFSLQALALRTQRVHIHGAPSLPVSDTAIYFDIEGLPNPNFYYLIGMLTVRADTIQYQQFWADSDDDQATIFQDFANAVTACSNFHLFHFGNYDAAALKRARRFCGPEYDPLLETIGTASTNVLSLVHSHFYFPVYSNSLKDIASFLGFKWTEPQASGIQSIIWRDQWTVSRDRSLKSKLMRYNREDCQALKILCDFIRSAPTRMVEPPLCDGQESTVVNTTGLASPARRYGRTPFHLQELERASKCAYFDYQRTRVFVRTNRRLAKMEKAKSKKPRKIRINKRVELFCEQCPHCNSRRISSGKERSRLITDLRFSKSAVKRWNVQYEASRYRCGSCKKTFFPAEWPRSHSRYGRNLAIWCVYQNFACQQNIWNVRDTLLDMFGIPVDRHRLYRFKRELISSYEGLYEQIRRHVLESPVLHIDETDVAIRTTKGYVWIFATVDAVWYLYQESRSGEFLKDMLAGFNGVLISDFYAAYDSIDCPQQKCLLHLLRDVNDDVGKNPFDEEFKGFASDFGSVLREIVDTVDRYGLKRRHLNKHKKKAARFVERVASRSFCSEAALRYQSRFRKYGDRLFTFLNYDSVPWNNNGAEHAAKSFTKYNRMCRGLCTEATLKQALVMLSILETCKYNGMSFLRFLLTGATDLGCLIGRQN